MGFGLVEILKGNLRRLERAESLEAVVPIGVVIDPDGKAAFSGGIVVRFLVPI